MEFATEYAPQNFYCFAIDNKSPKSFHEKFRKLANCFPKNVFIAQKEFSIDSAGHNIEYAHFECFKELKQQNFSWKYVFNLQVI